ncbi:MAG: TIGR02757 family protein [Bacteroidetes bacterium]|nr:TIGR02757 family protein [Bacteroidota bacterium]MCL5739238.1 TIGR02757 family protein [Bacteroidota bacterium]
MEGLKRLQQIFEFNQANNLLKDFYLSDPIWFPKRFKKKQDVETAAFIAATFAIGPRYAIIRSLEKIFAELGESPYDAIMNFSHSRMLKSMNGHIQFAYKNITGKDVVQILFTLKLLVNSHGTIEDVLKLNADDKEGGVYYILTALLEEMKSYRIPSSLGGELSPRARALLASPKQRSACKRMNMFLRWMTRRDEIDFGFYDWLGTDKLVIPLDVNVSRAARKLKLTKRKTDNWKTAVEITEKLKCLDPIDPVKYDVPLFLYGIELRKGKKE